jgi:hypothetical protein
MMCSVCGRRPGARRLTFSEKFVGYSDMFAGSAACDVCYMLIKDESYRRSHWILVNDTVRKLSKSELLNILRDPPIGSLIYVKSSGRRLGFIKCLRFTSTRSVVALCGEDEGPILIERAKLREVVDAAVKAYSTLKRKAPLLEGCSASDWVYEDVCKLVEWYRGVPAWGLVVRSL